MSSYLFIINLDWKKSWFDVFVSLIPEYLDCWLYLTCGPMPIFHSKYINQTNLDSPHKFPTRLLRWKRSGLDLFVFSTSRVHELMVVFSLWFDVRLPHKNNLNSFKPFAFWHFNSKLFYKTELTLSIPQWWKQFFHMWISNIFRSNVMRKKICDDSY